MNEEKKVPFKWEYGEETISLQLGMYANNQRLYIGMITHTPNFSDIYTLYFEDVYKYLLALCHDEELAEELAQDTFFKAMKSYENFRGDCKITTWLCQIAKHSFFLYEKHRKRNIDLNSVENEIVDTNSISVIWKDNHFDYTPDLMTSWTVGNVFSGSNRDTWQTSVPYFLKGKEVKRYGKQKFKLFGANWKDHFYCVRKAVGNRQKADRKGI